MLFNSLEYILFLTSFYIIYWSLAKNLRLQNLLILFSSYLFYSIWDYKFLSLIIISSSVDYLLGKLIYNENNQSKKTILLAISIIVNIGILALFKYYNFFIENLIDFITSLGLKPNVTSLRIILPVGVSFYTFQTLSYTIDIYRGKIKPTKDLVGFFAFVAFFPQLVAGPIERASNLLPQINKKRIFCYKQSVDGMRQILWGIFKKVVIADNCSFFTNHIFENYDSHNGIMLILGVILFTFQIYADFSGYSDIAIGTSKLLGIKLMQNFSTPYFSRSIAEFWRRWHISLSTWFRDYLYFPLGGSRVSIALQIRNILITFLVSGLWHGANWTFIFWGLLHAILFIPQLFHRKERKYLIFLSQRKVLLGVYNIFCTLRTFCIISFLFIFFRSPTITDSFAFIERILNSYNISFLSSLNLFKTNLKIVSPDRLLIFLIIFILYMMIVEWFNRDKKHGFEVLPSNIIVRYSIYIITCLLTLEYFYGETPFIYFQF